ncbi:malate synthase G [Microlunatus antarcticus]
MSTTVVSSGPDVTVGRLRVKGCLHDLVDEMLTGTSLDTRRFWAGFEALVEELAPRNRALLLERDRLQAEIDQWHRDRAGQHHEPGRYEAFLREIGYLVDPPDDFTISTTGVDAELSDAAGPQLVVPVSNARFALNAANARWGSLYDALYGSDVIPAEDGAAAGPGYDPRRGRRVVGFARSFLDSTFPLTGGSHADSRAYRVDSAGLLVELTDGSVERLRNSAAFRGRVGPAATPSEILLVHHGLGVAIVIDRGTPVGADDPAGVADVLLEAAVTTIVDFEDSVAAVDAEDKVAAYRSWWGLCRGTLQAEVHKRGSTSVRSLEPDRRYSGPDGEELVVPARALMLVRNVGHLMTTDAVVHPELGEVGEGVLDGVLTTLAALPGTSPGNPLRNGRTGSVYIVKPKMHGPDEAVFAADLFAAVERLLGLPHATVKIGVMDEERRTSGNLKAVIHAVRDRIVFVNTGFLDRTGDEIHTSMQAGVVVRKAEMRNQPWIAAYEDANVDTALAAGLGGRAQIGKGMWAMPDLMADMLAQKAGHLRAGASTAWVPSPTAAVIHALHYHEVDVRARQSELAGRTRTTLSDLLTIPLAAEPAMSAEEVARELDNNAQSILGYVVRWIDQGVGCSKVPDIDGVALMEDRATLRISSQLLANWLAHGVLTVEQVSASLARMAAVVDQQNAGDPAYRPMTDDPATNIALATALELVVEGAQQPNGYTEPVLHRRRRQRKAAG